jgi:hypothetical protein
MVCIDYDLCDRCHSAGVHDEHQMLKIEHPNDAVAIHAAVCISLVHEFSLSEWFLFICRPKYSLTKTTQVQFFWASEFTPKAMLLSAYPVNSRTVTLLVGRNAD